MNSSNTLHPHGTIRSVPLDSSHLETEDRRGTSTKNDGLPRPLARQTAISPSLQNPAMRQNPIGRAISSEFGPTRFHSANNLPDSATMSSIGDTSTEWSSAVGAAANAGKSGRVIEKLMGENDSLKRQLKYESLKADEANQAYKSVKSLLDAQSDSLSTAEQTIANQESSLRRKERANGDLKLKIVAARLAAETAADDELKWRTLIQKMEKDSTKTVEEANTRAALFEGRANTMSSHWKSQNAQIERTCGKLRKEITEINQARQEDDRRMTILEAICEQQRKNLGNMDAQNESLKAAHERYKMEQERALKDIKMKAAEQEKEFHEKIKDADQTLGELKWALGIKENVRGAR
ncbi:hypothetical protein BJ878DRAFT_419229 [Calycina marina]|uniref:SWI5-dependent HO expression protein 3 n=1 Tax=Calycina marina TaxID=1763456 RepID=A0A9P7Z523_9HELO|nr:hypothetical protein BJ878DRAFT_419229 [Calycina marina]